MNGSIDLEGFRKLFADQAVVFTRLPAGRERDLAAQANETSGRGDGSLHTFAEFDALYELLRKDSGADPPLRLTSPDGRPTETNAERMNYWLSVLTANHVLASTALRSI